ncbi:MAG: undecaprenyl-diphosphate phosphatase [bacterium]|nr:undecaprenyl-diphosphate phosphatase [bacterium]
MSEFFIAIILGLVEGLTEFLPISSTGHMIIVGHWLGFEGNRAASFEVAIQLGAILAVVVLYWRRFTGLVSFKEKTGFSGISGMIKLAVASLPALIAGAFLHKYIKENLFSPTTVCFALVFGGVVMILIEKINLKPSTTQIENISFKQSFYIGIFQVFALWPGMSRSASTIVGGMVLGVDRKTSAEFSFLIAVPIMVAAIGYDLLKSYSFLNSQDVSFFATGFIVAFISAILSIRFLIAFLGKYGLIYFGIYRIILGFFCLSLL